MTKRSDLINYSFSPLALAIAVCDFISNDEEVALGSMDARFSK